MFSSNVKIKIHRDLYARLAEAAKAAGYASTDELITHVLEREVEGLEEKHDDEQVEKRLRGLGYIE